MDIPIRLTAIAVLFAAAAFFAISEVAIVKVRVFQIEQLLAEGNKQAIAAKKVMDNPDNFLCLCQIGITFSILAIGWLSYKLAERLISTFDTNFIFTAANAETGAWLAAFIAIAFLLTISGEVIRKSIAARQADKILLTNARLLIWCYRLLYTFILFFQAAARFITRRFGLQHASRDDSSHSEEELKLLLSDSFKKGAINSFKYGYLHKLFKFDHLTAKEIMVPRTAMCTIEKNMTLKEAIAFAHHKQFTRYPITDGTKDRIVGVVNLKQLLIAYIQDPEKSEMPVETFALPVIQTFETTQASKLLLKIQQQRIHMAILRDEYGGTSGLVTLEDILEEIVGDIRDEFDNDEVPEIQQIGEGHYIFDAKLLIDQINGLLGIDIAEEDIDTIGGWFMSKSFDTIKGQKISEQNYDFLAKEIEGRKLLYLEVQKQK